MICSALKANPTLVQPYVRPIWLQTMDYIKDIDERSYSRKRIAMENWLSIAKASGLEEKAIRQAEAKKLATDLRGCSWYQCVFFAGEAEGAAPRMMLLDENCRTVQYCSVYCQKWSVIFP